MRGESRNKVMLEGNVGKKPVLRHTPKKEPVLSFSLATNHTFIGKQSMTKKEVTYWHSVVLKGDAAEKGFLCIGSGAKLYIEGRLTKRFWEDDKKQKRVEVEVVVDEHDGHCDVIYPGKGVDPDAAAKANSNTNEFKDGNPF